MLKHIPNTLVLMLCLLSSGCIGTIIGTTVDAAIEVVKVPFKVGGAVKDVVTDDDFTGSKSSTGTLHESDLEQQAVEMENNEF